jgi:hypothetical protein
MHTHHLTSIYHKNLFCSTLVGATVEPLVSTFIKKIQNISSRPRATTTQPHHTIFVKRIMTATSIQEQLALLSTVDVCTRNEGTVPAVPMVDPSLSSSLSAVNGDNDEEEVNVVEDSPSIASNTDSSSEADGINDVWLNITTVDASSSASSRPSYCHIEFDSNVLIGGEDNNTRDDNDEEEQEFQVPNEEDDDDFEDPRRYGNRRSGSLRSNFRAGTRRRTGGSLSSFLQERGTPRVVEDDDSLVRNRMERQKNNSRMPSWSDSVLDMMGEDDDCIDVPMKE